MVNTMVPASMRLRTSPQSNGTQLDLIATPDHASMRLRTSPQSNSNSSASATARRRRTSFNEAADFAAEQPHQLLGASLVEGHASMRLRISPQSNVGDPRDSRSGERMLQ